MSRKKKSPVRQEPAAVTQQYSELATNLRRRDVFDRGMRDAATLTPADIAEITQLLEAEPGLRGVISSNPALSSALSVASLGRPQASSDFVPAQTPPMQDDVASLNALASLQESPQPGDPISDEFVYRETPLQGGPCGEVPSRGWSPPATDWSSSPSTFHRSASPGRVGRVKSDPFAECRTIRLDGTIDELEVSGVCRPAASIDVTHQRRAMQVHRLAEKTMVVAVIMDKEQEHNRCTAIGCDSGVALGGYAHDVGRDAYLVQCVDAVHLGCIPFSFMISYAGVGNWKVRVPICEDVLLRSLSEPQNKRLEEIKIRYRSERYHIDFMQLVSCS